MKQNLLYVTVLVNSQLLLAGNLIVQPVTDFAIDNYLGTWYEIARLPVVFEKDLVNVTATYSKNNDGKIVVLNEGYKKTRDGRHVKTKGSAKFAGARNVGHLRVTFFWPFYSDYILFVLDKNYDYAMVAGSSYEYLWILCRKPKLDPSIVSDLIDKAKNAGFPVEKLIMTPQG